MNNLKVRLIERFNFFLERQFVKGTQVQLLFVVCLIGLLSIAGGFMVMPLDAAADKPGEAFWWAFLRLTDPGYLGDDEGMWRRIVSTFLTIAGNVVFIGSLVAIITTWLNRKIRTLEQGLTRVSAQNHIVILGWTNRTVHVAAELTHSRKRVKRFLKRHGSKYMKLIVLADDVNPYRLQELKDHPQIGKRANEIILRSGEGIDREHLQRVDSKHASAIIIPSKSNANRELITPDVETIKTLLSLNSEMQSQNGDGKKPFVVAEIQDENKVIAARRAYKGPLEVIPSDAILSRLIAQNLHHYGLSVVFNELLSHSQNNNLYVQELPEMEGKSLFELKALFPRAIIFGVVREKDDDFVPLLNPGIEFTLKKNDRLILLARNLDDVEIVPDSLSKKSEFEKLPDLQHTKPTSPGNINGFSNLLVLGWNHQVPALIRELGTYTNESFQLTLASLRGLEDRKKSIDHILETSTNVNCIHVVADYIRESELRSLHPSSFDHILFLSSDRLPDDEEADARTIVGYTLLEEVLETTGKQPQIIMELTDPGNEMLIKNFKSESIIGPLILSNLLATIAMRRELYTVYEELFTVGGAEIIFRNIDEYNLTPRKITFRELENHIAEYDDTALGYYREEEDDMVDLQLNINRDKNIDLQTEDRLVVLSTINTDEEKQ
ncbi:MAG: ion channel DMI1 [Bacteroidetes bacterium]|jgi:hypothetical protein|nr:ion channel DMI1 [Bacteroidota bacterium]